MIATPVIRELAAEGPWPTGITRGFVVFTTDHVSVWSGTDSEKSPVAVTVLECETATDVFRSAARSLESAVGDVVAVKAMDPDGRWVIHTPVLGGLADFPGLGLKLDRKLEFFSALCERIVEIHERGEHHGALTPWAVALGDGMRPQLVSARGDSIWAGGGGVAYLAPEVLQGAPASARSDVYSLGRLLAFVLASAHPSLETDAVPRLAYLAGSPAGLTRIVRRATLTDPKARYANSTELLADVRNYGNVESVGLMLPGALELNLTGMSAPPDSSAKTARSVAKRPPREPRVAASSGAKSKILVAIGAVVALAGAACFFTNPLGELSMWSARRTFASGAPADRGPAFAKLVELGAHDLGTVNLAGANLSSYTLTDTSLHGADLSGANLDGTDFSGTDLSAANLEHATARGANLASAFMDDVKELETVTCDAATQPPEHWRCADQHFVAVE